VTRVDPSLINARFFGVNVTLLVRPCRVSLSESGNHSANLGKSVVVEPPNMFLPLAVLLTPYVWLQT
jgi:hypothetical protein